MGGGKEGGGGGEVAKLSTDTDMTLPHDHPGIVIIIIHHHQ